MKNKYMFVMFLAFLTLSTSNVYAYGWDDFTDDFGNALSPYIAYMVIGILWPVLSAYASKLVAKASTPAAIALTIQGILVALIAPAMLPGMSEYYMKVFNATFGKIF